MPSLLPLPLFQRLQSRPWLPRLLSLSLRFRKDPVNRANRAKDKCKGKGIKPPSEDKDAAKAMEAEAKAKEAEAKTKEANPKAKDAPTSQLSQKEAPPPPKAKA